MLVFQLHCHFHLELKHELHVNMPSAFILFRVEKLFYYLLSCYFWSYIFSGAFVMVEGGFTLKSYAQASDYIIENHKSYYGYSSIKYFFLV